jgi:hypothetical protein
MLQLRDIGEYTQVANSLKQGKYGAQHTPLNQTRKRQKEGVGLKRSRIWIVLNEYSFSQQFARQR